MQKLEMNFSFYPSYEGQGNAPSPAFHPKAQ